VVVRAFFRLAGVPCIPIPSLWDDDPFFCVVEVEGGGFGSGFVPRRHAARPEAVTCAGRVAEEPYVRCLRGLGGGEEMREG
jgi:hypothetical protein